MEGAWALNHQLDVCPLLGPLHVLCMLLTGSLGSIRNCWGQEEKGTTEDEMAGWYHRLDGHDFE